MLRDMLPELAGFHKMVAASMLIGRLDLHPGNWGWRTLPDGTKLAATVDYGRGMQKFDVDFHNPISQLTQYGLPRDVLISDEFIDSARQMLDYYRAHREEIQLDLATGLDTVMTVYRPDQVRQILGRAIDPITTLDYNATRLEAFMNRCIAESAIAKCDIITFSLIPFSDINALLNKTYSDRK